MIPWLLWAGAVIAIGWPRFAGLVVTDPDDALRIVQVRDLVAGQGWWDITQYRINPAGGGGLMHWSRIVDAPMAGAIGLLSPLVGGWTAERLVFALWPLLLAAPLFPAMARIGALLHNRGVAAWAPPLLALSMTVLHQFRPLRIDHHGWQVLLAGLMLVVLLRPSGSRSGWLMGGVAAALLAISLEGLPIAALFGALMAAEWVWAGEARAGRRLRAYLLGLSAGAIVLQWATRGPAALWQNWCDALSLPWLAALVVAATLFAATFAIASRWERTAVGAQLRRGAALLLPALACAATLLGIEPACARGPFASLDPLVFAQWYLHVGEGLPLWRSTASAVGLSLAPTIIGLSATLYFVARAPLAQRRAWLLLGGAACGAAILSLFVLRSLYFAHLFVLPGTAALAAALWSWGRGRTTPVGRVAAIVPLLLVLPPTTMLIAVNGINALSNGPANGAATDQPMQLCLAPVRDGALDREAPGVILAPLYLGPHVLQHSRHAVVATGHHRNNRAMAATLATFVGDPDEAERRARDAGATIMLTCTSAPEWQQFVRTPGDSLAKRLAAGRVPGWLVPIELGDPSLRGWRLVPPERSPSAERPAAAL